jgi:hypothetical protein
VRICAGVGISVVQREGHYVRPCCCFAFAVDARAAVNLPLIEAGKVGVVLFASACQRRTRS